MNMNMQWFILNQSLACVFNRFSSQQLTGPFWLEVVNGDMFAITAVQHFLVAVLLLFLLKRDLDSFRHETKLWMFLIFIRKIR